MQQPPYLIGGLPSGAGTSHVSAEAAEPDRPSACTHLLAQPSSPLGDPHLEGEGRHAGGGA